MRPGRDLVIPMITLNHGVRDAYPRVVIEREDPADVALTSQALRELVPLGLRARADRERDAIDEAVAAAIAGEGWEPMMAPLVEPILAAARATVEAGEGAEQFRRRLPALLGEMDDAALARTLHRLGFGAALAGGIVASRRPPTTDHRPPATAMSGRRARRARKRRIRRAFRARSPGRAPADAPQPGCSPLLRAQRGGGWPALAALVAAALAHLPTRR